MVLAVTVIALFALDAAQSDLWASETAVSISARARVHASGCTPDMLARRDVRTE